jgi:transposase InsO family protein
LLGVNRQVYYRSVKSKNKQQKVAFKVVLMVRNVRLKMPRIGTRKLYHILQEELKELGVGRDRLFDIIRANHMCIVAKRQYHVTTNSHHRFRKHKNLISGVTPKRPEQIWASDITYIGRRQNPIYLALVTDAYSKKIMGYSVSNSLALQGSVSALKMALRQRRYPSEELIHHSDRGLQYCSDEYQKVLSKNDIKCSMTEQYDPYENAVAERVNGILKQEFINGIDIQDCKLMTLLIKQSILIYNEDRPHSSCHMKTPEQMHRQRSIRIKTYKKQNSIKTNLDAAD